MQFHQTQLSDQRKIRRLLINTSIAMITLVTAWESTSRMVRDCNAWQVALGQEVQFAIFLTNRPNLAQHETRNLRRGYLDR